MDQASTSPEGSDRTPRPVVDRGVECSCNHRLNPHSAAFRVLGHGSDATIALTGHRVRSSIGLFPNSHATVASIHIRQPLPMRYVLRR
jgi:hypothetical protein